jgi:hypothetical protein
MGAGRGAVNHSKKESEVANQALVDQKERKIEVKRERLLETLRSNRDKHLTEYREALQGYKAMATEKLNAAHAKAKADLEKNVARVQAELNEFDPNNPQNHDYLTLVNAIQIELRVPRNFTDKYDAAIDMVEWDVRETLELTHAEFQCFVRDVWEWTRDFNVTNAIYSKKF